MKAINSTILFLLIYFVSNAQTGNINGVVVDYNDDSPIEYTTISLHRLADSTLLSGAVTNPEGLFEMSNIPYGKYFLKVKFIGYQTQFINNVQLSGSAPNFVAGPVKLKNSDGGLKEVTVTTEKGLVENKIDKKVFNADKSLTSKGGTGLDLLRDVPSVDVDESENITLRGDAKVTILIDGRPSSMPVSQLLKQIPATAIEKVEIITNPSAKYDPEGMSGILNIIMKKNKTKGFNGNVVGSVGYGYTPKTNGSIGLNYRSSKVNLYTNYNFNYGLTEYGGVQNRRVLLGDTLWDHLLVDDVGEYLRRSNYVKTGIDWFANDNNTIYLSGTYSKDNGLGIRTVNYTNYDTDENVSFTSVRNGTIVAPNKSLNLNGGWQKTFKNKENTLDLDLTYSNNYSNADETLDETYFDNGNNQLGDVGYQNTYGVNDFSLMLGKLDYVLPINDSTTLEAGFHFTGRRSANEFNSESKTGDGDFVFDSLISNSFRYDQDTYAAYMTFGKQINKIGVKGGLRAEQTYTGSRLLSSDNEFANNYFQLFPSFHLSYRTDNNSEFQWSYSKRINRPQIQMLNPFTNYSDPYTLEIGNPYLKPELIHVGEMNYMKYFTKFSINSSVYYRYITNLTRKYLYNEGEISYVSYTNLGNSSITGADLTLSYALGKSTKINSTTNFWYSSITDELLTGGVKKNLPGLQTNLRVTTRLKKGWTTQIGGFYTPRRNVIGGEIIAMYGVAISAQKMILKNKGSLSVRVRDVFNTREFMFIADPRTDYTFTSARNWESRTIYVTFSYSFGKMVKGKQKRRGSSNDSSDDLVIPGMQ